MSTHKHIDKICLVAVILSLLLCVVFMNGSSFGIQIAPRTMGYEDRLFDDSKVHTIDIIIDDWDAFLETAQTEKYSVCDLVIDGEPVNNVGIRGKGNTSLSSVSKMGSDRYSFKIEFDQYDSTKTYHGLDKLSLNNIIQDNTYMKDYLSYQMMNEFGVPSPLCSYVYITVNGEDWGLYLAVEAVEESFLQRNYGSNYGELYKPDNMNMGGGRGNGKDFVMPDFANQQEHSDDTNMPNDMQAGHRNNGRMPDPENMRGGPTFDEEAIRDAFAELNLDASLLEGIDFDNITIEEIQSVLSSLDEESKQRLMAAVMGSSATEMPDMGGRGGFGGSSETKLQYIDDDPDSYSTIFDSAKTNISEADQIRLIASLKQLSEYENLEEVLLMEDVIRYFIVHNYVVNGDSYTGSMIHNYYLYEEEGRLSMIPWDYNLAFGTFQGGSASSSVNDDIDEILDDRPMQAWIFSDDTYSQQYYALYEDFLAQVDAQHIIDEAYTLIAPYVEKDPTAFCTYEEFKAGVEVLKEFCTLRTESVRLQLTGSTDTVDVGDLNLSDMGTMMNGMGGDPDGFGDRGGFGGMNSRNSSNPINTDDSTPEKQFDNQGIAVPGDIPMPGKSNIPANIQRPNNTEEVETASGETNNESTGNSSEEMPSKEAGSMGNPFSPDNMPNSGNMRGFSDRIQIDQSSTEPRLSIVLLISSLLVLAIGLLITLKFKR